VGLQLASPNQRCWVVFPVSALFPSLTTIRTNSPEDMARLLRVVLGRHLLDGFHHSDNSQVIRGKPAVFLAFKTLSKYVSGM